MKKSLRNALCSVMAAILFFSPFGVYAKSNDAENTFNIDYSDSKSGYSYNVTLKPSELMKMLYGEEEIQSDEAGYLDAYYSHAFIYSPNVSAKNINIEINGDTVNVAALPESYTAVNGETVTWYPCEASYGDVTEKLNKADNEYTCTFELDGTENTVSVKYECEIALPEKYIEDISNFAYNDAQRANKINNDHKEALEQYNDAIDDYNKYLDDLAKYQNDLLEYNEYTEKLNAYNESLAKYNAYLLALSAYNRDTEAYSKYLKDYEEYLSAKAEYEKAYAENRAEYDKYILYLENLSKIRASTAYIESLFTVPSDGNVGCLFDALQNKELVAMIEKYQGKLVWCGVNQSDIDSMCEVSDELNELLRGYSEARNVSEEEAFAYYKKNYGSITQKFNFLYDKLTTILTPTIYNYMCGYVEIEYRDDKDMQAYKKWRIRNVLCHIYLICRGLDDGTTSESTWSFYSDNGNPYTYNFSELLSQNVILADTNSADPQNIEWWSGDIPAQGLPKVPTMPTEVAKPVAPMEVKEPVKPTEVAIPYEPNEVKAPETRPRIEDYDIVLKVAEYYDINNLNLNQHKYKENGTLNLDCTVERAFSADGTPLDVYYSYNGTIFKIADKPTAHTAYSLYGGNTLPIGDGTPPRPETEEYTYTFDDWSQTDCDNGDTLHYPTYKEEKRKYTVTFLNSERDELYSYSCEYGETPEYPDEDDYKSKLQKDSTAENTYEFDGWLPPLSAIKSDTEFTAQFYENQRLYEVTWKIRDEVTTQWLAYGATVTMPSVKSVEYIGGTCYTFTGWDSDVQTVTGELTYTAQFEKKVLAYVSELTEDGLDVYDAGDTLVLTTPAQSTDISGLLKYAKEKSKEITLKAKDFTLKLNREAVASLYIQSAKDFVTLSSDQGVGYTFKDALGDEVRFSGTAYMELAHSAENTSGIFITVNGTGMLSCIPNGNYAEFVSNISELYGIGYRHTLEIKATENGAVFAEGSLYRSGDEVFFSTLPNTEYTVSKIILTDSAGNVTDITGQTSFAMPDSDISLYVEFTPKLYTVTFLFSGESYTEQYALGETITPPKIDLSFEKDGFIYSFIGWSEPVTIVTGDITFTAKYFSVRVEYAETADTQPALDKVIKTRLIPAAVVLVITVGAAVTVTVLAVRKHRVKKKKERK